MVNNEEQKSCCLQRAIPKEQKCAVSVYQGGPKVMRKMTAMLTKLPPFYYHQIKDAPHFLFYLKQAFFHSLHDGGVQQRNEWHPWGFGVKLRGEGVSLGPVLSLMFRSITCFFWGGVFFFGRECFFWGEVVLQKHCKYGLVTAAPYLAIKLTIHSKFPFLFLMLELLSGKNIAPSSATRDPG